MWIVCYFEHGMHSSCSLSINKIPCTFASEVNLTYQKFWQYSNKECFEIITLYVVYNRDAEIERKKTNIMSEIVDHLLEIVFNSSFSEWKILDGTGRMIQMCSSLDKLIPKSIFYLLLWYLLKRVHEVFLKYWILHN